MKWINEIRKKYEGDRFFKEVFDDHIYQAAYDLGKVDTVLDVGALAGEFSFYIYAHAKRIYALEPQPAQFLELINNIEDHNLKKIEPFCLGLSDENGMTNLRIQSRGGHSIVKEETGDSIKIETRTLNTFLEENKIESVDILKIDIESAEDLVFTAPDIDKAMKKIKFICGEHGNLDLIKLHGFEVEHTSGVGWIAKRI